MVDCLDIKKAQKFPQEYGKKLSSQHNLMDPFKKDFQKIIDEHKPTLDAIFNADKTGIYWKMLPSKTFVHSGEASAPERNLAKERVTLLLCANASSKKRQLNFFSLPREKNPALFITKCCH